MKRIFLKTSYDTGFLIDPADAALLTGIFSRVETAHIDYEDKNVTVTRDAPVRILFIEEANITRPSAAAAELPADEPRLF